jgi:5-methylcytosine-specific restriction endonuclease McrA
MQVLEYLQRKYGATMPSSILYVEAKIFGIPIPLESGWLSIYGKTEISEGMSYRLRQSLESRAKTGHKYATIALEIMGGPIQTQTTQSQDKTQERDNTKSPPAIQSKKQERKAERKAKRAAAREIKKEKQKNLTEVQIPIRAPNEQSVKAFINSHSKVDPTSDDFLSTFEWKATRMMALKKYGPVCQCCGASPNTGAVMNVDHINPRKLFPQLALDVSNLQILCGDCNKGKGNWDMTDWRKEPLAA